MLKSNFGVEDGDTDADVEDKVKAGLSMLEIDEASTLPYLLDLLSVKNSGIEDIPMSPAAKKDRILRSLQRLIVKGSERRPLILVFEDLHWTDKSSEESAKYLLESIPRARILMILTYRPEFVHTWGGKSFHNQINLSRLSNRESLAMVSHILGSDDLAMDLAALILEKTDGIPFFVEEFVQALKDLGIIIVNESYHLAQDTDRVAIPSSIQDVIMARVDSLPEFPKELLQAGSAVGREFSYKLIQRVTDLPEHELLSCLSALMYGELVYERGIFPESTYIFKHAITREVVYESILSSRKKLLHQKIGKAIEDLYRDSLDVYYGILADHFVISENFEEGANYSKLVSARARSQGALTSAISYAQKRITALEHLLPTPEIEAQLVDSRAWLGLTLLMAGYNANAKSVVFHIELTDVF